MTLDIIAAILSALLYTVAGAMIATRLFHHQGPNIKQATAIAFTALVAHLYVLSSGIVIDMGQNMSLGNVISLVSWLITLTMTVAAFYIANAILLPVVYGFSALTLLANLLLPDSYIVNIELRPGLLMHITIALFAYGCLVIALLYAVQVGYINNRLKEKKASILHSSLPPLMAVEGILFKLLATGTGLLTLSLLSGFLFLEDMFATQQAHKTVLSLMAWVVLMVILIGHNKFGWRGRQVISGTVVGVILLTLAYFGSRFVREFILGA